MKLFYRFLRFSSSGFCISTRKATSINAGNIQAATADKAILKMQKLPPNLFSHFKQIIDLPEIQKLSTLFKDAGYEFRVAGGAVRDLLTGVIPHDVDFATTATPTQMMDLLRYVSKKSNSDHRDRSFST